MLDSRDRRVPPVRTERYLIKAASEALKTGCANSEQLGCLQPDALAALAQRRLSFQGFHDAIDHIAACGPCFAKYNRLRRHHRLRRTVPWLLACAALLILGITWTYRPVGTLPAKAPNSNSDSATLTATVDYRNWTVERSGASHSSAGKPPSLKRAMSVVVFQLPIGSEDGPYDVQFRSGAGEIDAQSNGNAAWDGNAEILRVRLDLRHLSPGEYTVVLQPNGASTRAYPLILE
jgi:hypothetical protein